MKIGGLQKVSFIDFPGTLAAVVFTQGCNFDCPFCHNQRLIPCKAPESDLLEEREVLSYLEKRKNQLDGVVVSGGEPTLQPALAGFLRCLKLMEYQIKLDTNGSRPKVIKSLIEEQLVDFIAMDIKAPWDRYDDLAGCGVQTENLQESVDIITRSKIPCQFRTTWYKTLLTKDDINLIQGILPPNVQHKIQDYQPPSVRQVPADVA